MKIGLIGLALSGKTTVFNAVSQGNVEVGGYRSQKGEVNLGRVLVPDPRVDWLAELNQSEKKTYAEVEYIDVACFSGDKESHQEEEVPAALRDCDAFAHVVRSFTDPNSLHPRGSIDVRRDVKALDEELIFADLITIEKRLNKVGRQAKLVKDDKVRGEYELLRKTKALLEEEQPLRAVEFSANEARIIRGYRFFSEKSLLVIINVGEDDIANMDAIAAEFADLTTQPHVELVVICGKVQMELAQLPEEDRQSFLDDFGLPGAALDRMIQKSYDLLGLISFLTSADKETRAWTIKRGTTAVEAAGVIHEDFQRGFIRAQVVAFDDLHRYGSEAEARKQGLVRLEGKDYIIKDGDEILFRFNV